MILEELIDIYEMEKREKRDFPKYTFDCSKNDFILTRKAAKRCNIDIDICSKEELDTQLFRHGFALFIDSYKICCEIIWGYLNSMCTQKDISYFQEIKKEEKKIVVPFLFYFDHKDGLESFTKYETEKLNYILRNWCNRNGITIVR